MKDSRQTPPVNGLAYHLPDGPAQIMDAPGTIRVSFVLLDEHVTDCIVQLPRHSPPATDGIEGIKSLADMMSSSSTHEDVR